jgi:hypothetical protein
MRDRRILRPALLGSGLCLALAVLAAFFIAQPGQQAVAQSTSQTGNYTVQVVVRNAFSIGSSGLSFGTITALASPTEQASITVNGETGAVTISDGATGLARIIEISGSAPGEVDITGAPPNTLMSVSITTNPSTLTHTVDGSAATFSATINALGAGYDFTTDASGVMVFNVGGTLSTAAGGGNYSDGDYEGTYDVQVSY